MGLVARFTRDEASKYVWALLTMAAIGGLVFAIVHGGDVLAQERAAAQSRAVGFVDEVLATRIDGSDPATPILGQQAASLETALEGSILADERVSRVRLWSTDGTLLFSTDRSDDPGSNAGLNDEVLRQVSRAGVLTLSDLSDTGGADDPERSLLRTYAPLGDEVVAEIDQTDAGTLAVTRTTWRWYQFLAGALILVFLLITGLSLRDPIDRINVGVPFAVSSVPAGYSLIDDDRLDAVHEVYRLASERVAKLQRKLEASEEARRRLEGDIQRSLSKAATTPTGIDPPSVAPIPAEMVPEPAVVQVPESEVVQAGESDARAATRAGPLARASRDQKPLPTTSRKEKPATEKPKRVPKRLKPKPQKGSVATQEVAVPAPVPAPERRVGTASPTPSPSPAAVRPAASAAPAPAPAPAATPAPAPAPVARPPAPEEVFAAAPAPRRAAAASAPQPAAAPVASEQAMDDAAAHAAALETFIRLTESDRQHHDLTAIDQGAVRAALVRTAARKKPGGDRLQAHGGPPEESPGGPPPDRQ